MKKKLLNYSRKNNTMHIFLFHIGDLLLKLLNAFFSLHQQTHCRYDGFHNYQFIVSVILQPFIRKEIELRYCVSKIKNNIKKLKGRT